MGWIWLVAVMILTGETILIIEERTKVILMWFLSSSAMLSLDLSLSLVKLSLKICKENSLNSSKVGLNGVI